MDNKRSELSKPVGHFIEWQDEETGEREWCECSKQNGVPLYSQEYVSALLAELKSSQAIANEYQQLMYHMDAGGDFYEFQRDKAMKEQSNG